MATYATSAGELSGTNYTLKASAAETASTTGAAVQVGSGTAIVSVAVTAASGTTPTMTVVIEGSADGTNFMTLGTVGANGYSAGSVASAPSNITGAVSVLAAFDALPYMRYRSVIAGTTPSFTYSVSLTVA